MTIIATWKQLVRSNFKISTFWLKDPFDEISIIFTCMILAISTVCYIFFRTKGMTRKKTVTNKILFTQPIENKFVTQFHLNIREKWSKRGLGEGNVTEIMRRWSKKHTIEAERVLVLPLHGSWPASPTLRRLVLLHCPEHLLPIPLQLLQASLVLRSSQLYW